MENKKGTTVLLTVIGIATLLVAVVGATFAYFTASVADANEGTTNVEITAANLGTVTFNHGNLIDLCTDGEEGCVIFPGAKEAKDFTIVSTEASVGLDYVATLTLSEFDFPVGIDGTNTNVEYRVWTSNTNALAGAEGDVKLPNAQPADAEGWNKILPGTSSITLGRAKVEANATDTWNVEIRLVETGAAQNNDQGKKMTGTLEVTVPEEAKYTVDGEFYTGE